jgi:hemin uptake protein HemP
MSDTKPKPQRRFSSSTLAIPPVEIIITQINKNNKK